LVVPIHPRSGQAFTADRGTPSGELGFEAQDNPLRETFLPELKAVAEQVSALVF
jgi:hypothetical protein